MINLSHEPERQHLPGLESTMCRKVRQKGKVTKVYNVKIGGAVQNKLKLLADLTAKAFSTLCIFYIKCTIYNV